MTKPEEAVEKHLFKQCKALGYMCLKFTSPGNNGVPDRLVIGNGHTMFIELKAPGKTPRRLQDVVIAQMREHGAVVRVADSTGQVDDLLAEVVRAGAGPLPTSPLPDPGSVPDPDTSRKDTASHG
jgi:hypothetical protein